MSLLCCDTRRRRKKGGGGGEGGWQPEWQDIGCQVLESSAEGWDFRVGMLQWGVRVAGRACREKRNNTQTGHNGGSGCQDRLAGHPAGLSNMPGERLVRGI